MSLVFEKKDRVAYITLNRPEARNAGGYTLAMTDPLNKNKIYQDITASRVIVS